MFLNNKRSRFGGQYLAVLTAFFSTVWSGICFSSAKANERSVNDVNAAEVIPIVDLRKSTNQLTKPYASFPECWGIDFDKKPASSLRGTKYSRPGSHLPAKATYGKASYWDHFRPGHQFPHSKEILTADGRMMAWYGEYLKQFDESPYLSTDRGTRFRFVLIRSMDTPICISVVQESGGKASIYGRQSIGKIRCAREWRSDLTTVQLNSLKSKLKSPALWIPDSEDSLSRHGQDVSIWIVEKWDGIEYRHIEQFSPKSGAVQAFGTELLILCKLSAET